MAKSSATSGATTDATSFDQHTDELPAELDAVSAGYVGQYQFPDNARRRWPALVYFISGAALVAAWFSGFRGATNPSPYLNNAIAVGGLALLVLGAYHLATALPTRIEQTAALTIAARELGFPIGHAAGQMAWRGWRSRPTWRLLVYSAEEPPRTRGVVLVDAADGRVIEKFTEDNPENWSDFDRGTTALRRPGE